MKTFPVSFHQEDAMRQMNVQKLSETDFEAATIGGTRHLFEVDTNIGFFVYFDAVDGEGKESYLVLHYEGEQEEPTACYGFSMRDFYEFMALFLNDLATEEEEDYGALQHLAHLMHHIVEDGKSVIV